MDSQLKNRIQSSKRRMQRGVSLIEILVVLVILVVGILTIIRLFPSGFFSIQSTGNAALANSLGSAAVDLGAQNSTNLPDAILPDSSSADANDILANAITNAAAYSNYDPDDPNNLENARVVSNETVTIPTVSRNQSIYVVKYGPVLMPADPIQTAAQLPSYFTVNSPYWAVQTGNSAFLPNTTTPTDTPQENLVPGQEKFLVDLTNKKIAVPYAAYTTNSPVVSFTLNNGQSVNNATSYRQKMVLTVTYIDTSNQQTGTFTKYLDVAQATPRTSGNPYAPFDAGSLIRSQAYLPDTYTAPGAATDTYQGGWFDPTTQYLDSPNGTMLPSGSTIQWLSATLYRPYNGIANNQNTTFGNDPYQFKLTANNIVTILPTANNPGTGANPGAIGFNPKAATGSGAQARKAQISYIVYNWGILREDHDIPALTGAGSTFVVRTTVPNLLLAGSANPDNSINPGIAGSSNSIVIMDLDSGTIIAPSTANPDPTIPDKPINNEDLLGTNTSPDFINASYSLGRLTFGSNAFGDNPNGTGTAPAHRIRLFYTADLNWSVAVQKAPAYLTEALTSPVQAATGTTALGASQFAYDKANAFVYFARCNAGKTVEIDGTYTSGGKTQGFSDTIAVDPTLNTVGDSDVRVNIGDSTKFQYPVPANAAVTFSAVRGLSARSVVAWKERNQYKTHTVDAVLSRTP